MLIELRCVFLCLNSMYSCRIGSVNRCNNITWFAMTQQKFSVQYVVPVFHSHIKPKFVFFLTDEQDTNIATFIFLSVHC